MHHIFTPGLKACGSQKPLAYHLDIGRNNVN
jgi:hypothetical protein